jgi:putative MATE family efflux protein
MMFGAGLNILLDPIFIYTFQMGVTGAAYATILSMAVTSVMLSYWLFLRKDTYVSFKFRDFKFNKDIIKDIFRVGLPASVQQLSMSFTMIVLIVIIDFIGGGDAGVAIYNTGWRVISIAILPLLGMATAVVSVCGAVYGAKAYEKLNTAYMYAIKVGFFMEIVIALAIFLLAPFIAALFTSSADQLQITPGLELFLKVTVLFYPGAAFGIASSAMFQGTGKGSYALIATILRTIVLTIILALTFTVLFNMELEGIWWAIVIGNLLGSIISFAWGRFYVYKLKNSKF